MAEADLFLQLAPDADALQQYGAAELCGYLQRLFGLQVAIGTEAGPGQRILLGTPQAVHIRQACRQLPALSDQGQLRRRLEEHTLVLAGGTSAAVAWAGYELVQRYGVRYLLHGDVFPRQPGPFHLPEIDLHLEPKLRLRSWRQFNDLPTGPALWSLAQALRLEEDATLILDLDFLSLFFPVLGILLRSMEAEAPMAEGLFHVRALYEEAQRLLDRAAPQVANPAGQAELAYWRSRLEFAVQALIEKEQLHEGGMALWAARRGEGAEREAQLARAGALRTCSGGRRRRDAGHGRPGAGRFGPGHVGGVLPLLWAPGARAGRGAAGRGTGLGEPSRFHVRRSA